MSSSSLVADSSPEPVFPVKLLCPVDLLAALLVLPPPAVTDSVTPEGGVETQAGATEVARVGAGLAAEWGTPGLRFS